MADEEFDAGKALLEAELAATEAKAAALRRVLAARGPNGATSDFVLTADDDFHQRTGHKPRAIVEAIRAGKLAAC